MYPHTAGYEVMYPHTAGYEVMYPHTAGYSVYVFKLTLVVCQIYYCHILCRTVL